MSTRTDGWVSEWLDGMRWIGWVGLLYTLLSAYYLPTCLSRLSAFRSVCEAAWHTKQIAIGSVAFTRGWDHA